MIQARTYESAMLTAINLLSYFDNRIKEIKITFDGKYFWVHKEEFTADELEKIFYKNT